MRIVRGLSSLSLLAGLLLAAPLTLWAVEPEQLPQRVFDVQVESSAPPVVTVTFALALSEIPDYPVTITAISGAVEELLYDGVLSEGCYRVRAPLTKIAQGPIKIVLRTRVTNRTVQGPQSYLRYLAWEGTLR